MKVFRFTSTSKTRDNFTPIAPLTINELQKAMKNLSRACINPCTTSRAALVWCCILCYASPVANSLRFRFTPGPPLQLYVRFFLMFFATSIRYKIQKCIKIALLFAYKHPFSHLLVAFLTKINIFSEKYLVMSKKSSTFAADFGMRLFVRTCITI